MGIAVVAQPSKPVRPRQNPGFVTLWHQFCKHQFPKLVELAEFYAVFRRSTGIFFRSRTRGERRIPDVRELPARDQVGQTLKEIKQPVGQLVSGRHVWSPSF